ncbi:hypothetical protein KCU92_g67, partial [Aureobasidium melanogenum]
MFQLSRLEDSLDIINLSQMNSVRRRSRRKPRRWSSRQLATKAWRRATGDVLDAYGHEIVQDLFAELKGVANTTEQHTLKWTNIKIIVLYNNTCANFFLKSIDLTHRRHHAWQIGGDVGSAGVQLGHEQLCKRRTTIQD